MVGQSLLTWRPAQGISKRRVNISMRRHHSHSNTPPPTTCISPSILLLSISTVKQATPWVQFPFVLSYTDNESIMSDPVERDVAGLRHGQDEQQPSNLPQDQEPAQVTHANPAVEDTPGDTLSQLRALVATLKKDGKSFQCICKDGVLRNLHFLPTPPDQPTEIAVYDAIPLSPEMLKAYLDRRVRWSQETEDRFRGVDGTSVPQE
jgi:hypothetical protein